MGKEKESWLYEKKNPSGEYTGVALLNWEEEQIIKAMRKVNQLFKKYKSKPNRNKLILFCGGSGCDIRYENPSGENVIETFPNITCEGGDGGDVF